VLADPVVNRELLKTLQHQFPTFPHPPPVVKPKLEEPPQQEQKSPAPTKVETVETANQEVEKHEEKLKHEPR
jgi:hypothetical protein